MTAHLEVGDVFTLEGKTYLVVDMGDKNDPPDKYPNLVTFVPVAYAVKYKQADLGWLTENAADVRRVPAPE